ncbi:hypothetical protein CTA2_6732 [Colletotrichum tanaceti]|nr:hypothetical protein CTA2_6732 [Colletotrichum tanaceti]
MVETVGSDGRLTKPLRNDPATMDISYTQCVGACLHSEGQAVGCHVECVNQVPTQQLSAVLEALTYSYEPARSETNRRTTWLHQTFSSLLGSHVFSKKPYTLPPELLSQITAYCYSSFAIEYAMARLALASDTKADDARTIFLDTSRQIWARLSSFEGVDYIASLSNASDDLHTELIFKPDALRSPSSIHTAENHLGVRKIIFHYSKTSPEVEQCDGLWWRNIHLRGPTRLVVQSDGLKVRHVSLAEDKTKPRPTVWAKPLLGPTRLVRLEEAPLPTRMSSLLLNDPRTIGYAFYWNTRLVSMHAVTSEQDLSFYDGDHNGIWTYFPLLERELITEIWIRGQTKWDMALILKTSRDRIVNVGPYLNILPGTPIRLLELPSQATASWIFFELYRVGVRHLGFSSTKPEHAPGHTISLPAPMSSNPGYDCYFYSTAVLDKVNEITPCQRMIHGQTKIIGLLLRYSDGRRASLGQVRFDCLTSPLKVDGIWSILLTLAADWRGQFVSALSLDCVGETNSSCLRASNLDTLDWWFSLQASKVYLAH